MNVCDSMYMGMVYKAAYLLAFFSFLRISNLVPHSVNAFSVFKHLTKADVIFAPPGAHIIVKWTKTMQFQNKCKVIKIPFLLGSSLCPVTALGVLLRIVPGSKNDPLFQVRVQGSWSVLTDSRLRKHFKSVLRRLSLHNTSLTFHSFKRSGATLAFNSNVSLQHIKSHGTWTSDTVWRYINDNESAADQVALSFKKLLITSNLQH